MSKFLADKRNLRDTMLSAYSAVKVLTDAGKVARIKVDECESRRSLEQNARFHALCGDIARQRKWANQAIDEEGWKRLLVDAWARAENKPSGKVVPSLDGSNVVFLGIQTRRMRIKDMSDLIDFATAWAIENGVQVRG